MQPVNVLPTFVSQDADLKNKDSSGSSKGHAEDTAFSSLVDKHIDEEKTLIAPKEAKSSLESATAINGKASAENGKNDVERQDQGQETDSKIEVLQNTDEHSGNKTTGSIAIEAKENQVKIDESEQFISLLYNSDLTLAATDKSAKSSEQEAQVNKRKEGTIDALVNKKEVTPDVLVNKKESTIDVQGNNKDYLLNDAQRSSINERDNSALSTEHKLKVFSNDEPLIRAQLKNDAIIAKQSSEQVLKDYQQLIQSKQGQLNNQNIVAEQVTKAVLEKGALAGNKLSDIATSVAQANKSLLNENVDTGLYQRPVEPIGGDKPSINDLTLLNNESAVKVSEQESVKASELLTKPFSDLKAQSSEGSSSSDAKLLNKVAELVNNKDTNGQVNSEKSDTALSQINLEKMKVERNALQGVMAEPGVKAQAADIQTKPVVIATAQTQVVQQVQVDQKEKAEKSDLKSSEDTIAEYDYADSLNLSELKPKEQGINTSNKTIDNLTIRSVSEIQNQAIQANQIKQNSDAYIEHQSSEILNHTVASDTAQIQKNNVQLQQETISIFKKDFADAVKDKVMVMINQKLQQFDITLDPPEFGNMQVRVNLQGEQAAVNFVVQNQQAKDALEQNMHKLRDMLSEQGVDVGGANVEQQGQRQSNDESGLGQGENNSSMLSNQEEVSNADHVLSAKLFDSSATGVDYYA